MKLLVCGGAGFIGSNFVRLRLADQGDEITVLDKLTYAGRRENLEDLDVQLIVGGIEDPDAVAEAAEGVDAIVNFAAETHVDRSIAEPEAFITTHGMGTYVLLEEARKRDHRRLGVRLDLFHLADDSPGSPFWHPKGMVIWNALEDLRRRENRKRGYVEVKTPLLYDI